MLKKEVIYYGKTPSENIKFSQCSPACMVPEEHLGGLNYPPSFISDQMNQHIILFCNFFTWKLTHTVAKDLLLLRFVDIVAT